MKKGADEKAEEIKTYRIMTTQKFVKVARKLAKTSLIYTLKKGEHSNGLLGISFIADTDRRNAKLWRNYGTLENIVITETKEHVNKVLEEHNISEFKARSTKSGRFCRLIETR